MGTDTVDLTVIGTTVSTLMIITAKTSMTRVVTSVTGVTDRTKLSSLAALHAGADPDLKYLLAWIAMDQPNQSRATRPMGSRWGSGEPSGNL